MSGWTIAQISGYPDCLIQQPVEGTVKKAFEVKKSDKGERQFFFLKDDTGEIGVTWFTPSKDAALDPVKDGDRVRIQAKMGGKNKLSGASKGEYQGKPTLSVYGDRLENLSRQAAPQSAPAGQPQQPAGAAAGQAGLSALFPPPISEAEAVDTYWRIFERQAAKLSRFMQVEDFEGFMAAAKEEDLTLCHQATAEVFRGILAGRVTPGQGRTSQPATPKSPEEEYFDDGDIPF